jgi:hypothetical protein
MLKINTELGYRPRDEGVEWQVELDTVQSYLDGRTRTRDEAEALRPCPDAATPAANG